MNRRQFLKVSATGLVSVAFSPWLISCGAAAVGGGGVVAGLAAKTVSEWLADFVGAVGVNIVADSVVDWVKGLDPDKRNETERVNNAMISNNFNVFNTPVYGHRNTIFYGVGNQDGFNACTPFFAGNGADNPLIEGPILMGIAIAGTRWNNAEATAADGLIPTRQYQNNGSQFERSLSAPFHYDTNAGTLDVAYRADPTNRKGKISLVAAHPNGGTLWGEDYDIAWA